MINKNLLLGFAAEGRIVFSKIQSLPQNEAHYLKILKSKKIHVIATCLNNIFTRWNVNKFHAQFKADLERFLGPESDDTYEPSPKDLPEACTIRLDMGFISFGKELVQKPTSLANPGIFFSLLESVEDLL